MRSNSEAALRSFVRHFLIAEGYGNIINYNFGRDLVEAQETTNTSNPATAILTELIIEAIRKNAARPLIPILRLIHQNTEGQSKKASALIDLEDAQDFTDNVNPKSRLRSLVKLAHSGKDAGGKNLASQARLKGKKSLISGYLKLAKEFADEKDYFFMLYDLAGKSKEEAAEELAALKDK